MLNRLSWATQGGWPRKKYALIAVAGLLFLKVGLGYGDITDPLSVYIKFFPTVPTDQDMIQFSVDRGGYAQCDGDISIYGLVIDQQAKLIKISSGRSLSLPLCPGGPIHDLGILPAGLYQVMGFNGDVAWGEKPPVDTDIFSPERFAFTAQLLVVSGEPPKVSVHETPAEASIQSGVSLIRGWVCEANKVEASIDGGSRILLAYGTSREDTRPNCGDANNGYGMVFNWGLLSPGQHNLRIFINDNTNIANTSFETVSLGESFVTGIEKQLEVPDFPAAGQSVILQWMEADQNFRVIQYNH